MNDNEYINGLKQSCAALSGLGAPSEGQADLLNDVKAELVENGESIIMPPMVSDSRIRVNSSKDE